MALTEDIVINPLSVLLPRASFVNDGNCVSLQLNFTLTGGSFSISVLKDTAILPPKNSVLSLPFGRIGIVKQTGRNNSSGGLLDTISGPALPLAATQVFFASIDPLRLQNIGNNFVSFRTCGDLAQTLGNGVPVIWLALNPLLRQFAYRGISLQGIQQLAGNVLAEVVVNRNIIYVVAPGTFVGTKPFVVPSTDIVSEQQQVDYSLEIASVLNPALTRAQVSFPGDFVFDSQHAQKQGNSVVQCGAPTGTGSRDFVPIPDDWMVEGEFEDWTPAPGTDFTNPNSTANNGRYWKVFQSPQSPGKLRGILSFTRLIKDLKLPGNIATFVGSPITAETAGNSDSSRTFLLGEEGTEQGIYGFSAEKQIFQDAISGQQITVQNAMTLTPPGGDSGPAASNFYTIQIGLWTFPRVNPQSFPVGDPTNPFGLPPNVVVVNPSSNVVVLTPGSIQDYWNYYLAQYRRINSGRLKTTVQTVYRNQMPQPGDELVVPSLDQPNCGRISSVTVNFNRSGMTLAITAEVFAVDLNDTDVWISEASL